MRAFLALLTMMVSLAACAQDATYKAGVHYQVLNTPVTTADPNKIEVTEVFWYGCGHCFRFEPMVNQWAKQQGEDVNFVKSPAMWNGLMETHARAYYAAKALGVLDKVHQPLFNALNLEKKRLADENELAELFAQHGVAKADFTKAYKSFGVSSQVRLADANARGYQITGTPEMIVEGKYRVSAKMAGGQKQMLDVVNYLVTKARAERG
ncbi:thiol:disulfide interchange protein DsbA [Maricurvus nonylphenolicus]|uniref:thiol:disulfide interchange protein DsbA/DsbL n=1 Tax=Maricurvus nonylphenolicus TaxID=1008307 RepID=UPI0036F354E2